MTTPAVAVFGSSETLPGTTEWAEAEYVGSRLGSSGLAVITGGYGGTMEAVSKGASEAGGHVIGVTAPALFPERAGANPHVEELIEARDLMDRIGTIVRRAQATITLPGSIGTAAELFTVWNLNHISWRNGAPLVPSVAVGHRWRAVVQSLTEAGAEEECVYVADGVADAVDWLLAQQKIC